MDERAVIDEIVVALLSFGIFHMIGRRGRGDVLRRAGQSDDPAVERRDVVEQHLRRVTFRVQRHEQNLHAVGGFAELGQSIRQIAQSRGTHIRAMRVAEEDE